MKVKLLSFIVYSSKAGKGITIIQQMELSDLCIIREFHSLLSLLVNYKYLTGY